MKKYIHLFILIFIIYKSYSQELFEQKKTVAITKTIYSVDYEVEDLQRKDIKIFDKKGRLVTEIEFGFHHNRNLNLVGNVRSYLYQKNKLISEKSYSSGIDYQNNKVLFYSNYDYDKSKLITKYDNYSTSIYSYDLKNKIIEWIVNWNSTNRKYFKKYDNDNNILEEGEYNNWLKKYIRKGDTLNIINSKYNNPKIGDTAKNLINQVYKKGKLVFKKEDNEYFEQYIYSKNEQLKSIFTTKYEKKVTEFKYEMYYYSNGIIQKIEQFNLINNNWLLKQKIKFEVKGNTSVFSKKEIEKLNKILNEYQN